MKKKGLRIVRVGKEQKKEIGRIASDIECLIMEDGGIVSILEDDKGYKVVDYVSHFEDDFIGFAYKPEKVGYEIDDYDEEYLTVTEEAKTYIGLISLSEARRLIRKGYKIMSSPFSNLMEDLEKGYKAVDL